MNLSQPVVTRIAPSPTGRLHVGTARAALFNFLFAKKHGGTFILRIEDTDKVRSKKEFEDDIVSELEWLELTHDAFFRQSECTETYVKSIEKLIGDGNAYLSKEPKKDNPDIEVEVVRLRNPNKEVTFTDLIRGDITFDTTELGDFVIARSRTEPLYHLTVVVDDNDMKISHVIRGEDHISNTPRQILIQEALDFPRPKYAHVPLILAPDRSKLSKRHGATSIAEYRDDYLPEAFVNYLALLGWNPGDDQEIFTLSELIKIFDITKVQKGGAIFDVEKLKSLNHSYLQNLSDKDFEKYVLPRVPLRVKNLQGYSEAKLKGITSELKERIKILSEIEVVLEEFDFYFLLPKYDAENLTKEGDADATKKHLSNLIDTLQSIAANDFKAEVIKKSIWE